MAVKRRLTGACVALLMPTVAWAQSGQATQAQAAPAPTIKLGATMFADYTITETPKITDSNGDEVTASSFNVTRTYINLTGNVTSRLSFRITPDITRNTDSNSSANGSLLFRIKYAYAQMKVGSRTTVKFGIHQTPLIGAQEGVYRYRFQGTSFVEREGGLASADAGLSVTSTLPDGYGEVMVGLYNGEGYSKPETNDQKALMMRASVRPMPTSDLGKGLQVLGYYHVDHYVHGAPRTRMAASAMFEHARFNAGVDWLRRVDQTTVAATEVTGKGYSFFVNPFFDEKGRGVEGLVRFDSFDPDTDVVGKRTRLIAGAAYWFPKQGSATAALLANMEQVRQSGLTPTRTTSRKFSLNLLVNF